MAAVDQVVCLHPLKAYRKPGGGVAFNSIEGYVDRPLELPCNQCIECRRAKSREWALRCIHEAQMHEQNSFITLTYDQANLPDDVSVDVRDWQLFAKRLRKNVGPFRFLHVGEYGEKNYRPHYHACLFGIDFREDRELWKHENGNDHYVSDTLTKTWNKGIATIGNLTMESAAYVARYCLKKLTGPAGLESTKRINTETGEEYHVRSEYITMSRKPGLATDWYKKYKTDVFPHDEVVHDGQIHRPPKFYDQLHENENPQLHESIKTKRRDAAKRRRSATTPERLKAREKIQMSRLGLKQRNCD